LNTPILLSSNSIQLKNIYILSLPSSQFFSIMVPYNLRLRSSLTASEQVS